jgi:hypothetical protein
MLRVVFEGDDALCESLDLMRGCVADLQPVIQGGLQIIADGILDRIIAGIKPDILPESRESRRFDSSTPPLWDSGRLADAATATHTGVDGSAYELTADGGTIGIADPLFEGARRHQDGFTGPDSRGRHFDEPARAFIVLESTTQARVYALFDNYIADLMRA